MGIMPQTPEATVLRLLIETGALIVGAQEGSLLVVDEDSDDLRFAMTVGSKDSEDTLIGQRVPLGKGITGLAATTGEVHIGAPTFKDVKQSEKRGGETGAPEAVMAAPMMIGDTLVGVITAVSFEKGKRFGSQEAKVYGSFASIAAVVVDQRRRLATQAPPSCADDGDTAQPKVFGEAGRLEQQILSNIGKLVKQRPGALRQVSNMIESVVQLVMPEEEDFEL